MGTFYGVGLGPGEAELITVKGLRILQQTRVILIPHSSQGQVAREILEQYLDIREKEIIELAFLMERDADRRAQRYEEHVDQILPLLEQESVAMVCLGDVSLFSTVQYLSERLKKRGITVEMIPGVTSFCAAAASLGIPLTSMNEPLHILPESLGEKGSLLSGTRVYMKGVDWNPFVEKLLEEEGIVISAAERVGLPGERLVERVVTKETFSYLTTLIVRKI